MERWLDRPLSIGVIGVDNGSPHDLFSKNVVLINYDRLTRFTRELSACVYDLCVLDECHYTKSLEAKRTKTALGIKARRRIALSGTPILNRPIEIYLVLSWLSRREWPETGWVQLAYLSGTFADVS
jgi:SWI/SNF-related matrix-associated actin-dependent regulator of chromatin subfamily A-like protein 1